MVALSSGTTMAPYFDPGNPARDIQQAPAFPTSNKIPYHSEDKHGEGTDHDDAVHMNYDTTSDCWDDSAGRKHLQSSANRRALYNDDWVTCNREFMLACAQLPHHALTVTPNTSPLQSTDTLSIGEGHSALLLEHVMSPNFWCKHGETPWIRTKENIIGCARPVTSCLMDNQVFDDPAKFRSCHSLQSGKDLEQFCFAESFVSFLHHVPPQSTSSTMAVQSDRSFGKTATCVSKTKHSPNMHEHHIQKACLICHDEKDQDLDDGEARHNFHQRGMQEEKVNQNVACRPCPCGRKLEKSPFFCKNNEAGMFELYQDSSYMPRPFHPATGRPQIVIPVSRRCLDTSDYLASKGTSLASAMEGQAEKSGVVHDMVWPPESCMSSSSHVKGQYKSPSRLPSTCRDSCQEQSTTRKRTKDTSSSFRGSSSSSHQVTATGLSTIMATTSSAVKPLNAYNYFYSEMRDGILQLSTAEIEILILNNLNSSPGRTCTLIQPGLLARTILLKQSARFSRVERKRLLLSKHWNKDRTTRRKHRTNHGKISFNHMNTLVSTEWNVLPESEKMFYKEVAEVDRKHYKERKGHGGNPY
jgi:hypothetical protein